MAIKKSEVGTALQIDALKQGEITLRIIGRTPLYFNAQTSKSKRDLSIGSVRKTAAEKGKTLKHDPETEFRTSVYRQAIGDTLLCFPSPAFKGAMATAALETPGITKTSVQRLIFLPQYRVNIWGRPLLKMDVVRSADINRTPDVRTRAFLPRWCSEITIAYIIPTLSGHSIASLLTNAGVIVGVGDFRQEKGRGSFGTFRVTGAEDMGDDQLVWDDITRESRAVQQEALDNPVCADEESEELLEIIRGERIRRAA